MGNNAKHFSKRYLSLRDRYRSFSSYALRFGERAAALAGPMQEAIDRVVQDVRWSHTSYNPKHLVLTQSNWVFFKGSRPT